MRIIPFRRRKLRLPPVGQLVLATLGMVAGAWLIAAWMVGVVLMVGFGLIGLDALLRDNAAAPRKPLPTHQDILERWQRAR